MECRNCLKYNGKACEFGLTWPCGVYVPHIINPSDKQGDLISRTKAKEDLLSWATVINKPDLLSREDAMTVLDMIPAVDAVPVVHAHWKFNRDGSGTCSNCSRTQTDAWDYDSWDNYCSSCGAKMDGGNDG